MKDLQNFNVSELSNEELKSKSGGYINWLGPWKIFKLVWGQPLHAPLPLS